MFSIGLITKQGQVPYGKREHGEKAIIYMRLIGGKRNLQRLQIKENIEKIVNMRQKMLKYF